jgi:hypothetical protein
VRVGLTAETWELFLYGENVFDNETIQSGLSSADQVTAEIASGNTSFAPALNALVNLPDPAVWGIRGQVRF